MQEELNLEESIIILFLCVELIQIMLEWDQIIIGLYQEIASKIKIQRNMMMKLGLIESC